MIWLLACSVLKTEPGSGDGSLAFPHPEGFDQASAHGAAALEDRGACLDCHQVDQAAAPRCGSCHEAYPHEEGWLDAHGGSQLECSDCHEAQGLQATESWACDSCHAAWPHPAGWEQPTGHGSFVLSRHAETALCSGCHDQGADFCGSCHELYPHTADWRAREQHGATARSALDSCAACHGEDHAGGSTGVACANCHASYPHGSDPKREHIHAARVGEGVCLACHEAGEGPSQVHASCATRCHGGEP